MTSVPTTATSMVLPRWVWCQLPLQERTGTEIFQQLGLDSSSPALQNPTVTQALTNQKLPVTKLGSTQSVEVTRTTTADSSADGSTDQALTKHIYIDVDVASDPRSATVAPEFTSPRSPQPPEPWPAIAVLLESPYPVPEGDANPIAPLARYSICAGPPRIVAGQPRLWTPATGEILPTLRSQWQASYPSPSTLDVLDPNPVFVQNTAPANGVGAIAVAEGQTCDVAEIEQLPFTGGWLGWFGHDLAREIEHLPDRCPEELPFPTAFWYEPDYFAVLDHQAQVLWLAATQPEQLTVMTTRVNGAPPVDQSTNSRNSSNSQTSPPSPQSPAPTAAIAFGQTQADYEAAVRQAKQHILAGDIFQANLSLRFTTQTDQSGWPLYQHLQQINPSPFASYWRTPWGEIVSCSPERLVQSRDRRVQTRPIAGTRPRGATPAQDQDYAQTLLANRKENAEHIMLVDLERNDLGRVCTWGTVQVDELLTIERYSHVMHLVSNVMGDLPSDRDWIDLVQAVFPGGTITGCPKVRCMEIIETLEPVRRNLFYGSCGYVDRRGGMDLNILIRTLLVTPLPDTPGYRVWGQVGAGIVADSDPTQEWYEALQKAQAQLLAIQAATAAAIANTNHIPSTTVNPAKNC